MSKIDNLKAVAIDYDIPVAALIDFCISYPVETKPVLTIEATELLEDRIKTAERLNLAPEYINGLKDTLKLVGKS